MDKKSIKDPRCIRQGKALIHKADMSKSRKLHKEDHLFANSDRLRNIFVHEMRRRAEALDPFRNKIYMIKV